LVSSLQRYKKDWIQDSKELKKGQYHRHFTSFNALMKQKTTKTVTNKNMKVAKTAYLCSN
jgi:hypothetical protein